MSRYIDADKLKTIKSIQSAGFNSIETIREWIDKQETADVVEVRHGYWFKDEKFYHDIIVDGNPVCLYHTCSVCGVADEYITVHERPNGNHGIARHIRNYCPNCGAKMDEKEQEHE